MTLLVLGSTGTLGRQVVKRALDEGFQVKCFVRNFRKAAFLKEWGAELIYGDLKIPETIPRSLHKVTAVIDASTVRVGDFDFANTIELESKKILIQSAQLARIEHYIFFSLLNAEKYRDVVPLLKLKSETECYLRKSSLKYTIFYLCGFFQGLIQQYALPILDSQPVWITQEDQALPYVDTQDVAKFAIKSLSIQESRNQSFPLVGSSKWTSYEIIKLCEKLSGQKSKISKIPMFFLIFLRNFTKLFQWTLSISDRLAFTNLLAEKQSFIFSMSQFYHVFAVGPNDLNSLDNYLQDYFLSILRKMKELNDQQESVGSLEIF